MTTATSWVCVFCGKREQDPQTGRCTACGRLVGQPASSAIEREFGHPVINHQPRHSPSRAYRASPPAPAPEVAAGANGHDVAEPVPPTPSVEAARAPEPEPEHGPRLKPSAAWLAETRVLRDSHARAAVEATEMAKRATSEAKRCSKVADDMEYVLDLFSENVEVQP